MAARRQPGRRQHGEGSVFQRSRDRRWVAVADLGWTGGKRDRRYFVSMSQVEARAKRDAFLARRRDGFTMPRGRPPTVADWCLHWLHNTAKPRVADTTWHGSYRSKVEDHIAPYFAKVALTELDEEQVEAFHRHLERKGLSAATIIQIHRIMSAALKAAVVRGRMARNPCSNVPPPKIDREEIAPPTAEETARILEACESWPNGARWILAIATGLRQGEALALEWRDVQLSEPASVTVRQSAARVSGELVVKAPKSRKSRRTVAIGPGTVAALKAHRKAQAARRLAAEEWTDSNLVFTSPKGKPVHPRADWQDWQDLLRSLGLPHYRVHDLRHGVATSLLEAGLPARVVQEVLGHSSVAFTMSAYAHVRPAMHAAAADALDKIVSRGL